MLTGQNEITNSEDVIDSRDVIARIEYLTDERDAATVPCTACPAGTPAGECATCDGTGQVAVPDVWAKENPAEAAELTALLALQDEAEGYCDWKDGATLVRDSYFTDYAQELCEDCGDIPKDLPHYIYIDWERTARDIQMDYTSVDFDGVEYWVR